MTPHLVNACMGSLPLKGGYRRNSHSKRQKLRIVKSGIASDQFPQNQSVSNQSSSDSNQSPQNQSSNQSPQNHDSDRPLQSKSNSDSSQSSQNQSNSDSNQSPQNHDSDRSLQSKSKLDSSMISMNSTLEYLTDASSPMKNQNGEMTNDRHKSTMLPKEEIISLAAATSTFYNENPKKMDFISLTHHDDTVSDTADISVGQLYSTHI